MEISEQRFRLPGDASDIVELLEHLPTRELESIYGSLREPRSSLESGTVTPNTTIQIKANNFGPPDISYYVYPVDKLLAPYEVLADWKRPELWRLNIKVFDFEIRKAVMRMIIDLIKSGLKLSLVLSTRAELSHFNLVICYGIEPWGYEFSDVAPYCSISWNDQASDVARGLISICQKIAGKHQPLSTET